MHLLFFCSLYWVVLASSVLGDVTYPPLRFPDHVTIYIADEGGIGVLHLPQMRPMVVLLRSKVHRTSILT